MPVYAQCSYHCQHTPKIIFVRFRIFIGVWLRNINICGNACRGRMAIIGVVVSGSLLILSFIRTSA